MWNSLLLIIKTLALSLNFRTSLGPIIILTTTLFIFRLIEILSTLTESISWLITTRNILVILRIWLTPLYITLNWSPQYKKSFFFIMILSLIILILSFKVKRLIAYFFFFESILIPIYTLVLGWGYQPERLQAATFLLFYTIVASLPLLMGIMIVRRTLRTSSIILSQISTNQINFFISIILTLAFFIKFPIYLGHLWLPKAHVEAPVAGSMILAGILLKLGGYGLCLSAITSTPHPIIGTSAITVAMVGGGLLRIAILRITDIKVAIANSSIVHIRIVIATFCGVSSLGVVGGSLIMIAHGAASSGIFGGRFIMYCRTHSRSLTANKGLITTLPSISTFWFILITINFAGPFTLNLYREILMIRAISPLIWPISFSIAAICFFSAAYNLNLYASSQQGRGPKFISTPKELVNRESTRLFIHLPPCRVTLLILINLSSSSKRT